jgi:long-subunit fatty acid transport protein
MPTAIGCTRRILVAVIAVLCWDLAAPVSASAQASLEVPLQFDFLNPGARSLAMGSAFAGLGDDATAAFTNPAGLLQLISPEASLEVRYRRLASPYLAGGRLSGQPSGFGIDTVAGARYVDSLDAFTAPSYLSFVYPTRRWAIAAYRHELLSVDESFESQGAFQAVPGTSDPFFGTTRELPLQASRTVNITNYGVSGALRLGPRVRIGAGFSVYDFELDGRFSRTLFEAGVFSAADFSREVARATQVGEDVGFGGSVGVQWSYAHAQLGIVYRRGPGFAFTLVEGDLARPFPPLSGTFKVPDAVSVGIRYRPTDPLTLTADYSFVRYSDLEHGYLSLQATHSGRASQFSIDDGQEFHAGAEYQWLAVRAAPSLRAGLWFDPNHSVDYQPTAAGDLLDERYTAYFINGTSLWHFTFGGGASLGPRLELNAAADLSSRSRTVSMSTVVRF